MYLRRFRSASHSNPALAPYSSAAEIHKTSPFFGGWTTKTSMPTAHRFLAAGVVNGVLYAVGGALGGNDVSALEAYDYSTNTWTTMAHMPTPRENLGVGVINGKLYALGGNEGGRGLTTVGKCTILRRMPGDPTRS